ncbi:hypothetical protein Anapl_02616 [Anas platyrhynchos]|uniref:Uncharacterized protein n=1 Tax=Anas platyrhynchos TaxID=8839 RepID=R0M0K7_ANAPL|nr:hypothetical protein Anapl_02616 [Anas platyrhynchos]
MALATRLTRCCLKTVWQTLDDRYQTGLHATSLGLAQSLAWTLNYNQCFTTQFGFRRRTAALISALPELTRHAGINMALHMASEGTFASVAVYLLLPDNLSPLLYCQKAVIKLNQVNGSPKQEAVSLQEEDQASHRSRNFSDPGTPADCSLSSGDPYEAARMTDLSTVSVTWNRQFPRLTTMHPVANTQEPGIDGCRSNLITKINLFQNRGVEPEARASCGWDRTGTSKGTAKAWVSCRCTAARVMPESIVPVSSQGQTESLGAVERLSAMTSSLMHSKRAVTSTAPSTYRSTDYETAVNPGICYPTSACFDADSSGLDFSFVPDQMFYFSLVMVNMALPHYTPLSGNYASATSESSKSHAESMRQLAPSLGMECFTFWIQADTVN